MAYEETDLMRRGRILFWGLFVLTAVPPLFLFIGGLSWPLVCVFHLVGIGCLIYSCVTPNCRWFGPVVTSFRPKGREVWLTLDDGLSREHTPQVLQLLKRYEARATFFPVGQTLGACPEVARAVIAAGHTIANHSATHQPAWFWAAIPKTAAREIDGGQQMIEAHTGERTRWFRPPAGMANFCVHQALHKRALTLVGWSARGFDTSWEDAEEILREIYRDVRPGAIVLLHETSSLGRKNQDGVCILEMLLRRLSLEEYRFVIPSHEDLLCAPSETRRSYKLASQASAT